MQNLQLDPNTGDYVVVNGRPVEDGTLNTPAYIRLKTRRTQWLYAPNPQFGADYYLFHIRQSVANDNALLKVGQRALQPLIDDGRATSVQVTETQTNRGGFESTAVIEQANGQESTVTFNPITN